MAKKNNGDYMRVTRTVICKEIKNKFDYDVKIFKGNGYFFFYSDDLDTDLFLSSLKSTSVFICQLTQLSVAQWINKFERILEDRW